MQYTQKSLPRRCSAWCALFLLLALCAAQTALASENMLKSAEWRKASGVIAASGATAPDPDIMANCAKAVLDIANNAPSYRSSTALTLPFLEESSFTVEKVNALSGKNAFFVPTMYDYSFGIFECAAVIIRENCKGKKPEDIRPAQKEVMEYFERAGYWQPGDGSLVSEYYHDRIGN